MKAFSERNPITIAVVAFVVIVLIALGAFYFTDLPGVGGGATYTANFAEASGLKSGDDVTVAGVRVGQVESVGLDGTHVAVKFRAKNTWIGDNSTAHIDIETLLGQENLDIVPSGTHALSSSTPIPLSRTTTPLDIDSALSRLSDTAGNINTTELAKSFDTLSATFANTPKSVRGALDGLTRISHTIASRDEQLRKLAANTNSVTATLQTSDNDIGKLIDDGNLLLTELRARSAAITALFNGTENLATQISGLVHDNEKTLGPALAQLTKVTDILSANRDDLDRALKLAGPYYRLLNNAAGTGPWLDVYLCGLFDKSDTPILDATAKRNCYPTEGS